MARPRKETDLKAKALKRYEELVKRQNQIDGELKGLKAYLKTVGAVKPQRRDRKGPESTGAGKKSATETILSLIGKSKEGISINQIMKETRFGRQTVNGVLNRMKKVGKVKALTRGIYVQG